MRLFFRYMPPVDGEDAELKQRMDILKTMLRFGHIAPTAPDTLASYPYEMTVGWSAHKFHLPPPSFLCIEKKRGGRACWVPVQDPFVLQRWPHVFFAGNQPSFATDVLRVGERSVRILAVPSFSATRQAIFLNLRTLEPHTLTIDTSLT